MQPHILILAAGASSRMGETDKLLLPIAGIPLLTHVAREALATGLPVTVALSPDRPGRLSALDGLPLHSLTVTSTAFGMGASLASGIAVLPKAAHVLVMLADMPEITTLDLKELIADWELCPDAILRATDARGTPGHPVGFPPWVRPDLLRLTGDVGARGVLSRYADRVRYRALPQSRATTDIDTADDWQKWQGRVP